MNQCGPNGLGFTGRWQFFSAAEKILQFIIEITDDSPLLFCVSVCIALGRELNSSIRILILKEKNLLSRSLPGYLLPFTMRELDYGGFALYLRANKDRIVAFGGVNRVMALRHRYYLGAFVAMVVGLVVTLTAPILVGLEKPHVATPITVGVLHSLSGTMAVSEQTVADATLFAIAELNAAGGVLGRRIEPILVDGQSDWGLFAEEAARLIVDEEVSAVFGCWTSACRKTVKPVFERHEHVLFYPVQYEGLEHSEHIVYTGAAPNQQIIPATKWSLDNLGRRIFLVGSDYVFPRTANEIIRTQVELLQGDIVGESYRQLGATDFADVVAEIQVAQPDVIFNTINGDSNIAFYQALRAAGIASDHIPVMSFSLAEAEVQAIGASVVAGDYAARNYFNSLQTPENQRFIDGFRELYGADYVTTAPMEAAYFGVRMWAQAVEEAGSPYYEDYRFALQGQSMRAPSGIVYIDPVNRHTWRPVLIGRVQQTGGFDIVWSSGRPIRPAPFPGFFTEQAWLTFLDGLYDGWGGHWAAGQSIDVPRSDTPQ